MSYEESERHYFAEQDSLPENWHRDPDELEHERCSPAEDFAEFIVRPVRRSREYASERTSASSKSTGSAAETDAGEDGPAPAPPRPRLHLDRRAGDVAARVAELRGDALLSPAELAAYLGVALGTLKRWRRAGYGPPSARVGLRAVRFRKDSVCAWLEQREARRSS